MNFFDINMKLELIIYIGLVWKIKCEEININIKNVVVFFKYFVVLIFFNDSLVFVWWKNCLERE